MRLLVKGRFDETLKKGVEQGSFCSKGVIDTYSDEFRDGPS